MSWAGVVAHREQKRNEPVYEILVTKPEGKRPFARSEHRCKDIEVCL
jgi:hypothetical protein